MSKLMHDENAESFMNEKKMSKISRNGNDECIPRFRNGYISTICNAVVNCRAV